MKIEKSFRKQENVEEIRIYDLDRNSFLVHTPKEFEVEAIPVKGLMENIDTDIHILVPYNDCEDFIVESMGRYSIKLGNFSQGDVEGRLLSKISPMFYGILKDYLLDVYNTRTVKKLRFFYYMNGRIVQLNNAKIVYDVGKLFVLSDFIGGNRGSLMNSDEFSKDKSSLMEYVSQTGTFYKENGKYKWSPGIYNIINRYNEEYDEYYNIVFELVINDDKIITDTILRVLDEGADYVEDVIRIRDSEGVLKYLEVNIHSTFDENGKLVSCHGLINDVTRKSNNQITKPVDFLLSGFKNSKKLALMVEPLSRKNYEFSEGFYNLIEKTPEEYSHSREVIGNVVENEAMAQITKLANGEVNEIDITFTFKVEGKNPKEKTVELYMERFDYGGSTHSIGFLTDVTEDKNKQKQLIEANEHQLVLIKEVHHRVKNNLQVLNSFLNLEKRAYKDNPNLIIDHMQARLTSLALLHEKTYNTKDFKNINLKDYIMDQDNQMRSIVGVRDGVQLESVVDADLNLSIEVITPLLLILDELTMNAIKHAFPDKSVKSKKIKKVIRKIDADHAELIIQDNGVGIDNPKEITTNLGCEIIKSLTRQLDGEIKMIEHKNGTGYRLVFPMEMKHTIEG